MRGTFANIRIKNPLVPGVEGGVTDPPADDASRCRSTMRRCATRQIGTPLVVLAGKEYGTGSSRDWAAKGTFLLGVRAVIAESFERIHRSNLVGHGRAAAGVPHRRWLGGAGSDRPRDDHDRRDRGSPARPGSDGTGSCARMAPRSASRRARGSIWPASWPTIATAAFCTTCCATWRRRASRWRRSRFGRWTTDDGRWTTAYRPSSIVRRQMLIEHYAAPTPLQQPPRRSS